MFSLGRESQPVHAPRRVDLVYLWTVCLRLHIHLVVGLIDAIHMSARFVVIAPCAVAAVSKAEPGVRLDRLFCTKGPFAKAFTLSCAQSLQLHLRTYVLNTSLCTKCRLSAYFYWQQLTNLQL